MRTVVLTLVYLILATPALATDGVLEINQTCAVQTGCFAGDTPLFPVTINGSAGHSYRLTSDLTVPDENTTGISISAPDVSLDLGGFAIRGVVACSGTPIVCTPTGMGFGVTVTGSAPRVRISHGSVSGMGIDGIDVDGPGCIVRDVRVGSNRINGIDTSNAPACIVQGSTAFQNGFTGIEASRGSTVSDNTAYLNGADGIAAAAGSTVSGNTVYQNGSLGISGNAGSTVSGNTAYSNGGDGILTASGSTVSGNTAYANGGDGIVANTGATVQRNTVRFNGGYGLNLGSTAAYRENVITSNTTGTVLGGVDAGANVIDGVVTPTP